MANFPKYISKSKLLSSPINEDGSPKIVASIVATLLSNKPLRKEEILRKIGDKHTGKTKGYLSNYFAELKRLNILDYDKRVCSRTWKQGANYMIYMGFLFMEVLKNNPKAVDSLQYTLMPKNEEQSIDFITCPKDDIFNSPNPFLDDVTELVA